MAYTLSNLLRDAWLELGQLNISLATTGTTTTIVDTVQTGSHGDDDWKNGAAIVLIDSAGANALPEGQVQRVSGYVDSTGTFTVDTAWTTAVTGGDTYGFVSDYYPLRQMIQLANMALQQLGQIALLDTSLTTVASQTEYDLPVACKFQVPLRIQVQGYTGDSNDNRWITLHDWKYRAAAPGSAGTIIFDTQPTATRTVHIWYLGSHPALTAYSSVISETIHPELAKWALVTAALRWQLSRAGGEEPGLIQQLNNSQTMFDRARILYPIWKPKRVPSLLTYLRTEDEEDEFTSPSAA